MNKLHALTLILMASAFLQASEPERFLTKVRLPSGQTAAVAEGDLETRSTGSYSIRLYDAAPPGDDTTFFRAGQVLARDGFLEKVVLASVIGSKQPEIVVMVRSAGTGGHLSAHAFTFDKQRLTLCASVKSLPPDRDPIAVLRKFIKKRKRLPG